ncbi:MAG: hypothetical protein KDC60_00165 [Bacteroidetes bacterium]|nr:hypothetical protein [Bacteroidota bacterium]
MTGSLNRLYRAAGVPKQGVHKYIDCQSKQMGYEHQLLPLIHQIRDEHPTMGCRDMYYYLRPDCMGRDKFEAFCKHYGFAFKRYRDRHRTTDSSGVIRFPDLTIGLKLERINYDASQFISILRCL